MAKPITAKSIKSKVVKQMKDLGTYRKEFEMIIDIFAGMLYQYQKLAQDYAD
ncbi:P27 family phage terminase small subunit, partial [Streptococcus oralis]